MKFPCELLAEPYLAQLRIQVARNLRKMRYTQSDIAELLQVSQPVVSGYLRKTKHQPNLPKEIVSRAVSVAEEISQLLSKRGLDGTMEAIGIGCHNCKIMRQFGPTCDYHRAVTSELDLECTACVTKTPLIKLQENKFGVLTDLQKFMNAIINLELSSIIPEIGLQVVHSIPNPETISDIAAFPDRIISRKNGLLADTPTFGGSKTTSAALLKINEIRRDVRTVATLKTSKGLLNRLTNKQHPHILIKGLEEDFYKNISNLEIAELPMFIVGTESVGYESITYLCTSSIEELIEVINDLV